MVFTAIDYCGAAGSSSLLVNVLGRSIGAWTSGVSEFTLYVVPMGTYSLSIQIPGKSSLSVPSVVVLATTITTLGPIVNCRDSDGDGFYAQTGCLTIADCNDSDPTWTVIDEQWCQQTPGAFWMPACGMRGEYYNFSITDRDPLTGGCLAIRWSSRWPVAEASGTARSNEARAGTSPHAFPPRSPARRGHSAWR